MEALRKKVAAVTFGCFVFAGSAMAHPPKPNVFDGGNKWLITGYIDSTTNHMQVATQEICFLPYVAVGTSIQGTWYSTSFPDWNGQYYQEGDELKMTGDYAKDVGHDHMTLVHTTYDVPGQVRAMAFKDWTEWQEDGKFGSIIGWGNAKLERVGKCRYPQGIDDGVQATPELLKKLEAQALEFSFGLPDRLTVSGDVAEYPGQSDLESLDSYQERTGVK